MERLQKVIAQAGIASRRKSELLITEGKVKVNGEIVKELGTKVSKNDRIEVNGVQIEGEEPVYYVLYKPTGVLSSVSDDRDRKVVSDFFPLVKERIYPVGRLDYDTSGVILMTNDGDFANILMHPKYNVDKVYVAKIKGIPLRENIRQLERGVMLEDGKTAPAKVKVISVDKKKGTAIVSITIHEGRNRQVRRMFEAIGHPVLKLKRERFGYIGVEGLNPGEYRVMTPHEVKQLRNLASNATRKFK